MPPAIAIGPIKGVATRPATAPIAPRRRRPKADRSRGPRYRRRRSARRRCAMCGDLLRRPTRRRYRLFHACVPQLADRGRRRGTVGKHACNNACHRCRPPAPYGRHQGSAARARADGRSNTETAVGKTPVGIAQRPTGGFGALLPPIRIDDVAGTLGHLAPIAVAKPQTHTLIADDAGQEALALAATKLLRSSAPSDLAWGRDLGGSVSSTRRTRTGAGAAVGGWVGGVDPGGRASLRRRCRGRFRRRRQTSAFGAVSAGGLPTSSAPDGDAAIVADGALALSSAGLAVSPGALGVADRRCGCGARRRRRRRRDRRCLALVGVSRTSVRARRIPCIRCNRPRRPAPSVRDSSKTTFDFFGATSYAGTLGAGATGRGAVALSDGGGGAGREGSIGGAAPGRASTLDTPVVSTAPAGAASERRTAVHAESRPRLIVLAANRALHSRIPWSSDQACRKTSAPAS